MRKGFGDNMRIRPYQPRDRARLREICLATATPRVYEDAALREWILLMYNDYYTEREPETCFVAANEADEAVGYVICAPDYARYRLRFLPYLPRIWRCSHSAARNWLFHQVEGCFAREYPAHLHIDIFPEYQRLGLGHQLMDALFDALRAKNVRGVMLGCGKNNEKGNAFYEKYGFMRLGEARGTVLWGFKF